MRNSKRRYYSDIFYKDRDSPKKTWEHINELLNKSQRNGDCRISELKINKEEDCVETVTSPADISNAFNDFFAHVGQNLAKKINPTPVKFSHYLNDCNANSFFWLPITKYEILDLILSLSKNKASGYDEVPVKLLQEAAEYVCEPLSYIFNISLSAGIFPDDLKIAKVIPLFKKGEKDKPSNYRPISVLPIVSKIFEKLVNARLITFLENNNVLFEHQYGFRRGYSTKHSLVNLMDQISKCVDNKQVTLGIFLDFAKAFDTIDHDILLQKLQHYGIRGLPLKWFSNYLVNRKQYVFLDGSKSEKEDILCGVPQGSVLGPTLFVIYINDLPKSSSYFHFRLFADDSNLFHTFESGLHNINLTESNDNLFDVVQWCDANKLTINHNKTKYVLFKNRRYCINVQGVLDIKGNILQKVNCANFIGINIDEHLTWKHHIDEICKKIRKDVGIIYKLRHFVTRQVLMMIYNAFILPHITYGIEVWGGTYTTYLNQIFVIQKRAVRAMTFKNHMDHSMPLFYECKILDLYKLYHLMICTYMYDLIHGTTPDDISLYCSYIGHCYETKQKINKNLVIWLAKTNIGKQCISHSGPLNWNLLENDIRNSLSRSTFRRKLKLKLLEEYKS